MFNMGSAPSLSDIAAVTKDGNGDGWGNGNGWWVLIILFAIFGGWGNGWGGQGRNGEEHVEKAIISMRDIWSEASPELKRRMKTELSTLVDGMSI